jgi:hypothetical protein
MAPSEEPLYRAPGPDGPAGSSSGPNGSLDALGENALKIILLGDSACGKSKLVERFLLNNYQSRQLSTYALTLFRHNATVDGQKVEIDFWDTAGQERFNSMHPAYYHLAHACILCFDVTRKQTYKNLPDWHSELVGDGAYPRGRHRPSSPPGVTEGAGRTYAHTAERGLGGSVAPGSVAPGSVAPGGPGPTQPVS